jgi:hypothetical protein
MLIRRIRWTTVTRLNIGVIYQASGRKTCQIWRPVVEEPHRSYQASNTQPINELVERLRADGPDLEIELKPGRVLVLPRGWVHNPHALDQTEDSVHLTFMIRERTGFWIGGKRAKAAIEPTPLRPVIAPANIVSETHSPCGSTRQGASSSTVSAKSTPRRSPPNSWTPPEANSNPTTSDDRRDRPARPQLSHGFPGGPHPSRRIPTYQDAGDDQGARGVSRYSA